ncbi:hypothetical protein GQ600_24059 [Phytophthora cactorum]|nr:hypothetical protein GQ600_24059 [Phytophthora cactorum]
MFSADQFWFWWLFDFVDRTAKEKRTVLLFSGFLLSIAAVMRTIRAWENIATECVIKKLRESDPKGTCSDGVEP